MKAPNNFWSQSVHYKGVPLYTTTNMVLYNMFHSMALCFHGYSKVRAINMKLCVVNISYVNNPTSLLIVRLLRPNASNISHQQW